MMSKTTVLQVRLLHSIACLFNMSGNNCMSCLTKYFILLNKIKAFLLLPLLSCHFFITLPFEGLQKLTLLTESLGLRFRRICLKYTFPLTTKKRKNKSLGLGHHRSCPQKLCSFWSVARITTSEGPIREICDSRTSRHCAHGQCQV